MFSSCSCSHKVLSLPLTLQNTLMLWSCQICSNSLNCNFMLSNLKWFGMDATKQINLNANVSFKHFLHL